MAKGLLLMAFDYSTAHADEFHDWYDLEHVPERLLPERLRVPGFLNAERWIDDANPHIHVATYDVENVDVLTTPAYRAVGGANQSVWTNRVTAMCGRIMRFEGEQLRPGDQVAAAGAGGLLVASMTPDTDAETEFNDWYDNEHLPGLLKVPGLSAGADIGRPMRSRNGGICRFITFAISAFRAPAHGPLRPTRSGPNGCGRGCGIYLCYA